MSRNLANLQSALDWLEQIVAGSLDVHFGKSERFQAPELEYREDGSWVPEFLRRENPTSLEFAVLMLTLAPHLEPGFLNKFLAKHLPDGGDLPEFGGVKGIHHRGVLPTGETAQFIFGGDDLAKRIEVQRILSGDHWLARKHLLWVESVGHGEPAMSGKLVIDPELVEQVTLGHVSQPAYSVEFPAELISTPLSWDDLVLQPSTWQQIREIENWIIHHPTLMREWGMAKRIKPGYRALFYGPPGTGKTLTAMLLGKHTERLVFRIDLSRVVSKYIGETEKNLERLFAKAEHKHWILFFDEADALFGKRTDIRDAHDKYANQEVSYLLQRIEGYNGLVILASNQRANIEDAFVRRLQNIVHFPMPRLEERYEIWRKTFPPQIALADDIDWRHIASRHELSGAGILNVTQFCAVDLLAKRVMRLDLRTLETAIQREYVKEGKIL